MRKKPDPITITDNAAIKIKELIQKTSDSGIIGIRIGVKQGGCSGLKYFIEFAKNQEKFEESIKMKGVTIFIEAKAIIYLLGTTMDYVDKKITAGFVFTNPNSKRQCSCGDSFNV